MSGYEESTSGTYLPPGQASHQLMVYDLNRLFDVPSKWKDVIVPDGANFKEITLHKVIVGGDPRDAEDFRDYPGCVLVNVPRLKIHTQALLTNAIKNLGIGLYPMEAASRENPARHPLEVQFSLQTHSHAEIRNPPLGLVCRGR